MTLTAYCRAPPRRRSVTNTGPEAYLRHILSVLPEWPSNRVDELLPWNVVLTNK
ncbi:transposase domain-containing protein [Escherichia coli]|uniref:transposase domain-containing protein n=1 Tax=Escherichia coli TaxID=562 RepID=UPI00131483D9